MMNKYTLTLIAAFLAGGCVGFLLNRKQLEEKYARIAEEEIEDMRRYFSKSAESSEEEEVEDYQWTKEELEVESVKEINKTFGYSSINPIPGEKTQEMNRQKRNYSLVRTTDTEPDPVEAKIDAAGRGEYIEEVNPTPNFGRDVAPYIIDEDQFSEELLEEHDKVSYTFYLEDQTLADEDADIELDVDGTVGWDNLDMKNTHITHPDTIYIRNERLGIDYEVSMDPGSFQEIVMGIKSGMSPREALERRMKRKEEESEE